PSVEASATTSRDPSSSPSILPAHVPCPLRPISTNVQTSGAVPCRYTPDVVTMSHLRSWSRSSAQTSCEKRPPSTSCTAQAARYGSLPLLAGFSAQIVRLLQPPITMSFEPSPLTSATAASSNPPGSPGLKIV